MIILSKWSTETVQTNSDENYTSYSGLEMKLVIHELRLKNEEKVQLTGYP